MLQRINDHIMRAKTLPVNFKLFIKAVELRIAFIDVRLDERSLRIAFPFEPLRLPVRLRKIRFPFFLRRKEGKRILRRRTGRRRGSKGKAMRRLRSSRRTSINAIRSSTAFIKSLKFTGRVLARMM